MLDLHGNTMCIHLPISAVEKITIFAHHSEGSLHQGLGGEFRRTNHQIIQQSRADMIKPYQVSMSIRLCQYGKHLNGTISDTMHKSNCIVTIDAYDLS